MGALREQMTTKSGWTHRRAPLYEIFHPLSRRLPKSASGVGPGGRKSSDKVVTLGPLSSAIGGVVGRAREHRVPGGRVR